MTQDNGTPIVAPMPAKVNEILVQVGERVEVDQELAILESMKMEVPLMATVSGTVEEIAVSVDDNVEENGLVMRIRPD